MALYSKVFKFYLAETTEIGCFPRVFDTPGPNGLQLMIAKDFLDLFYLVISFQKDRITYCPASLSGSSQEALAKYLIQGFFKSTLSKNFGQVYSVGNQVIFSAGFRVIWIGDGKNYYDIEEGPLSRQYFAITQAVLEQIFRNARTNDSILAI